jgi:hypothetical protein
MGKFQAYYCTHNLPAKVADLISKSRAVSHNFSNDLLVFHANETNGVKVCGAMFGKSTSSLLGSSSVMHDPIPRIVAFPYCPSHLYVPEFYLFNRQEFRIKVRRRCCVLMSLQPSCSLGP